MFCQFRRNIHPLWIALALVGCAAPGVIPIPINTPDSTPPTLQGRIPGPGQRAIDPASSVAISFSEELSPGSVNDTGFKLVRARDNTTVTGHVSLKKNVAIFTPSNQLDVSTVYTVIVTEVISDLAGNRLIPARWSFSTLEWSAIERLDSNAGGNSFGTNLAVSADGSAIAVWLQTLNGPGVWASRFTPTSGWSNATQISATGVNFNGLDEPKVSIRSDGSAIVVWPQFAESQWSAWSNRFEPKTGWDVAQRLDASRPLGSPTIDDPDVAACTDGRAIALWKEYQGVFASVLSPKTGWSTPTNVSLNSSGSLSSIYVGCGSNGDGFAAWDSSITGLHVARHTVAGGWQAETQLSKESIYISNFATGPNGQLFAVWDQGSTAWASRYEPSSGWGTAFRLDNGLYGSTPAVAVDGGGRALVIWSSSDRIRDQIWSRRFDPTTGWTSAAPIETGSERPLIPRLSMNANGEAVAFWVQGNRFTFWTMRYSPTMGWSIPQSPDSENREANVIHAGIALNGDILTLWQRAEGFSSGRHAVSTALFRTPR
jgi:Bacterial Ig-like domain